MSTFEKIFALCLILLIYSFSYAVLGTARDIQKDTKIIKERIEQRTHLPSECEEYYNDGTDRWKECMGVGYVPQ